MDYSSRYWIDKLKLLPHPEGGYFKETYRSDEIINKSHLPERFNGDRSVSTSIYFLLKEGFPSAFHKIKSDEIWHFYHGCSITIHIIEEDNYYQIKLGNNPENNELFQYVVKKEAWFAAEVNPSTHSADNYSLVGCTVSPGFDFSDFELADKNNLSEKYPQYKDIIERLSIK